MVTVEKMLLGDVPKRGRGGGVDEGRGTGRIAGVGGGMALRRSDGLETDADDVRAWMRAVG
jgi:hypothetical protein